MLPVGFLRRHDLDVELFELRRIDWARCVEHEVLHALRLRESDDVADVVGACEQHDDAVDPGCNAPMRRDAILEGLEQETEPLLDRGLVETEELEHPLLQLRLVDSKASARQLISVADGVVGMGSHVIRALVDELEVLLERPREGVMAVCQAAVVVFFEQVHGIDPEELPLAVSDESTPPRDLLAEQPDDGLRTALLVGHHQDEVALARPSALANLASLLVSQKFVKRSRQPREALAARTFRHCRQLVELLAMNVRAVRQGKATHDAAVREDGLEHVRLRVLEDFAEVRYLEVVSQVRFVGAVLEQRLLHVDARERKLERAVGAQVLVAEAARDLVVAAQATDHQDLLQGLWRLRQRVELTGIEARRHNEVARALWRRLDEQRGLYLDKLKLVHVRMDDLVDAMAKLEDALHARTAQVEIAVLETRGLVRERTVLLDQERGRLGDGDHFELRGRNLHLARCQLRVLRSRWPAADQALDPHDVLRPKVGGGAVSIRCGRRVEYDLHLAPAVAQVDEDQAAHVAPARDPAVKLDLPARICRANRAAVRSREPAHANRSGRSSQATSACSPLAMSRSRARRREASSALNITTQRA